MIWLKRLSIAAILGAVLGLCAFNFFYLLYQPILYWLVWAKDVSYVLLALLSLGVLVTLRLKWIAIFAACWMFIFLPELGFAAPFDWLTAQGFHVRALLDGGYISRCRLTDFTENGGRQTVGLCERINRLYVCDYIMYDTAGQFVLPPVQRTPEWKQAISIVAKDSIVRSADPASHLFGKFYYVVVEPGDPAC